MANDNKTAPQAVVFTGEGMSRDELIAALAAEKNTSAALKAKVQRNSTVSVLIKKPEQKIDPKTKLAVKDEVTGGVVSIYGLARFPLSYFGDKNADMNSPEMLVKVQEEIILNSSFLRFKGTPAEQAATRAKVKQDAEALLALYKPLLGQFTRA